MKARRANWLHHAHASVSPEGLVAPRGGTRPEKGAADAAGPPAGRPSKEEVEK